MPNPIHNFNSKAQSIQRKELIHHDGFLSHFVLENKLVATSCWETEPIETQHAGNERVMVGFLEDVSKLLLFQNITIVKVGRVHKSKNIMKLGRTETTGGNVLGAEVTDDCSKVLVESLEKLTSLEDSTIQFLFKVWLLERQAHF